MNGEDGKAERGHIFAMDGAIVFGALSIAPNKTRRVMEPFYLYDCGKERIYSSQPDVTEMKIRKLLLLTCGSQR